MYLGGWGNTSSTSAVDAGFQYNYDVKNWALFIKKSGATQMSDSFAYRFRGGQTLTAKFYVSAKDQVTVVGTGIRDSTGVITPRTLVLSVAGWPSNGFDSVMKAVASIAQSPGPKITGTYMKGVVISNKRIGASSITNHLWATTDNGTSTTSNPNPCKVTPTYVTTSGTTSATTINISLK